MFYIKFTTDERDHVISCDDYYVRRNDGWIFVTSIHCNNTERMYESNHCVGVNADTVELAIERKRVDTFWHSMFVMNAAGQTIDKWVTPPSLAEKKG